MVLISSCLLGLRTRYDGGNSFEPLVNKLKNRYTLIPVCPEVLGGLVVPRKPATIKQGDGSWVWEKNIPVMLDTGEDVTGYFKRGALLTLEFAKFLKVKHIILKENSPSCGIYHTNSNFIRQKGMGVTAYLLKKNNINVDTLDSFYKKKL
ncbi:MAG: hypothetical protein B5M53_03200 [Candidatus Cloacimonas sp. 4484_209]|nr:MAG: hypothetical protein B5M53_03200 [Candidatus Cloacimonas sp. 4484_209]